MRTVVYSEGTRPRDPKGGRWYFPVAAAEPLPACYSNTREVNRRVPKK